MPRKKPSFNVSLSEWDTNQVVAAKMELLGDGGSFYYLRKGEGNGSIEWATFAMRVIQQALQAGYQIPPWLADTVEIVGKIGATAGVAGGAFIGLNKAWSLGLRQLETFLQNIERSTELSQRLGQCLRPSHLLRNGPSAPIPRDIRVLCTRNPANLKALPLMFAIGARVRHRRRNVQTGSHRFFVNEHRCVFHVKIGDDRYLALQATDAPLRMLLKRDFLREWELCGPDTPKQSL